MAGTFSMPKIEGVECPVVKPLGSFGQDHEAGIGIGLHDFSEGPGVIVTLNDKDGLHLAAIMSPAKAKHVAAMLERAAKRGLRRLGQDSRP